MLVSVIKNTRSFKPKIFNSHTRFFSNEAPQAAPVHQKKLVPSPVIVDRPVSPPLKSPKVAVVAIKETEILLHRAQSISENLGLPLLRLPEYERIVKNKLSNEADFILKIADNKISLLEVGFGGPIYSDFVEGKLYYRRKYGENLSSPMVRAIKTAKKPLDKITVLDATGGLGKDAFVMACLGCTVHVIEKNPIIYTLLQDGIERAKKDNELKDIISRMTITNDNSIEVMKNLSDSQKPDVVYLDPMYPSKKKPRSDVKLDMRIIRKLVATESESYQLLQSAKSAAKSSVVLKRPYYFAVDPSCDLSYHSRSTHYDIYLTRLQAGNSTTNQINN